MALTLKPPRFHASCSKHTRYNPAKGGEAAIRGGCVGCYRLLHVWQAYVELVKVMKECEDDT